MSAVPAEGSSDDHDGLSPMHVAHHPLFTAREKIEMLEEMRAGVSVAFLDDDSLSFESGDIEDAIAEVRLDAQNGIGNAAGDLR